MRRQDEETCYIADILVLLELQFNVFLVNYITSFNDVLINLMGICHVWRE